MYPSKWAVVHIHNESLYNKAVWELRTAAQRLGALAVDTETTGLEAKASDLVLLQLATPDVAFVFEKAMVGREIRDLLNDSNITKIAHNFPFDWSFVNWHFGSWMVGWDTRKVAGILSPDVHSLRSCAKSYLGLDLPKALATQFVDQEIVLTPNGIDYAGIDALVLWPLVWHFLTYKPQRITQDDFLVTAQDLKPMADYVFNGGPWPTRGPSITHLGLAYPEPGVSDPRSK